MYAAQATLPGMKKPTVLTARSHADLLAAVPCILGFEPEESLVMLTFSARGSAFHARVDLPVTPRHVAEAVEALASAAVANNVGGAAIIAYTADRPAASRVADALAFELAAHGIGVGDMLLVQGDRYWHLAPGEGTASGPGRFDAQSHRFRAEAVLRGRVVHESRADLAATLAPSPSAEVTAALARISRRRGVQEAAEAVWLQSVLPRLARARELPSPDQSARVLADLHEFDLLDVVVTAMDGAEPDDWLDLWTHLTRCAPDPMRSVPAALLAFAAWRAGQGALAWCAVDRCREVDPGHGLAAMVAQLLERAVPPSAWAVVSGGASQDDRA